jgi:peroxiredoxin
MKRKIKTVLILVIVFAVSFFTYKIILKTNQKRENLKAIQTIPKFSFIKLNNETFSNKNLIKNRANVLINFNSECHFCQNEAQNIQENITSLKDIQILFISSEPVEKIKNFAEMYKLSMYENITFLFDKNDTFSSIFGTNSIPSSLIYNKHQKLIKKHEGQLMALKIIKEINNSDE